ncbi:DoxX family protein [Thauera chlorobenzoica]|uniref:Putative membrane protein n=1 Tax=Thauera chlorobenzoica TaxID=96773 RepID=A0A1H5VBV3_9RHOO|nr:DoxX family protein [Thauera chlorobenzoica]APR06257.1 putative membrane protein [Thauera chlorobenzoica]SEF84710.1 putative oxidoreductase [Thauera chlorobenzoica]
MPDWLHTPMTVAGRILLALMFVLAGVGKLANIDGTAGFMASAGLPASPALVVLVGLGELLAGLAVATGFMARWAALGLAVFTLSVSFIFHRYWAVPDEQQMVQQLLFMKNMGVAGGMLVLAALGPGPASLGKRRRSSPGGGPNPAR